MKVLSLNLHCHKEDFLDEKLKQIRRFIIEENIDVCLFQEVAQHKDTPIAYCDIREDNTAYRINKTLNYNLSFIWRKYGFSVFEEGLAILSKKKKVFEEDFFISRNISKDSWLTRVVLRNDFNVDNEKISFYTVHMGWTLENENYFDQASNLVKKIRENNNLVILSGDFNCSHGSNEYKSFSDSGLYSIVDEINLDTFNNPTFRFPLDSNHESLNRHIDFFFTNKKIKINEYRIVFKEKPVSDHYGILLDFDFL